MNEHCKHRRTFLPSSTDIHAHKYKHQQSHILCDYYLESLIFWSGFAEKDEEEEEEVERTDAVAVAVEKYILIPMEK